MTVQGKVSEASSTRSFLAQPGLAWRYDVQASPSTTVGDTK